MEQHHILIMVVVLLLLVNLGLNIALIVKNKKKINEEFTVINKDANTYSKSKDIIYTRVAEFDQSSDMNKEVLNFTIELSPNQNMSNYAGAFLRIDGLSVPVAIQIRQQIFDLIDPNTYEGYNQEIASYPVLKAGENKFSLTYENNNGDVILKLRNRDISFENDLSSIVGLEKSIKKVFVSFGSVQPTKWTLL